MSGASLVADATAAFLPPAALGTGRRARCRLCTKRPAFRPRRSQHALHPSARLSSTDAEVASLLDGSHVAVTGGTGLLGRATVAALVGTCARVTVLARSPQSARALFAGRGGRVRVVQYDASTGTVSPVARTALESADAVINLAGEPVDAGRWTPARKRILRASRVSGTRALADTLQGTPARLVSASAVGYYGTSPDGEFSETAACGSDFLARLAHDWESAAFSRGDDVVVLRLGVVLARDGGAVPKMAAAFRAFLGGVPGDGNQWFSWVSLDDAVRILLRAAVCSGVSGVYNVTAPRPVRLSEFCRELGRALRRPSWLPVPGAAVRAAMGSEAAQLILAGQRVLPARATADGFEFRHRRVAAALGDLYLDPPSKPAATETAKRNAPAAKR